MRRPYSKKVERTGTESDPEIPVPDEKIYIKSMSEEDSSVCQDSLTMFVIDTCASCCFIHICVWEKVGTRRMRPATVTVL